MTFITKTDDGYALASGTYAIVGRSYNGDMPDPRMPTMEHQPPLSFRPVDVPTILESDGLEMLVLPIGRDEEGATGRSICIGRDSIVAFGDIAIVALADEFAQRRNYRYASHIDEVVIIHVEEQGLVSESGGSYDVDGCDDLNHIDANSPGSFWIEGHFIDMSLAANAEAFGYGTDDFNATLDEHGFPARLDQVRRRLAERTDLDGIALTNMLSGLGDFAIAYYAPVA